MIGNFCCVGYNTKMLRSLIVRCCYSGTRLWSRRIWSHKPRDIHVAFVWWSVCYFWLQVSTTYVWRWRSVLAVFPSWVCRARDLGRGVSRESWKHFSLCRTYTPLFDDSISPLTASKATTLQWVSARPHICRVFDKISFLHCQYVASELEAHGGGD